jgi:hypothetical protein
MLGCLWNLGRGRGQRDSKAHDRESLDFLEERWMLTVFLEKSHVKMKNTLLDVEGDIILVM